MVSKRLFNGIAHDIAHHAQSSLSYLHPHVVHAIRRNPTSAARLSLLPGQAWPPEFVVEMPLQLATAALQEKFRQIVAGAGLDMEDLAAASLLFVPIAGKDDYTTEVHSLIITNDGKRFEHVIPVDW